MKVAILGDTHFGVRNDSNLFREHQLKFFKETFFPYLKKHNIGRVIQTGDFIDRRKYINFLTLHNTVNEIRKLIHESGIQWDIFPGNHDVFYKNTNWLCSLHELGIDQDEYIKVFYEPTKIELDGQEIALIPWITDDNADDCIQFMRKTTATVMVGHFEIQGFEMHKGFPNNDGFSMQFFNKFDRVISGHFHTRSEYGNITYVGTPYELTWADYNDPKGFHVFDTEDQTLEFVKNPVDIHWKIFYDEDKDYSGFDFGFYSDKIVRLIVTNKTNEELYEKFVDQLVNVNPPELKIQDNPTSDAQYEADDVEAEDPLTVIHKNIEQIEDQNLSTEDLKKLATEIHSEAVDLQQEK